MEIKVCRAAMGRKLEHAKALVAFCRERKHRLLVVDCLDRCEPCEKQFVAVLDGAPIVVKDGAALVSELSATE